MIAWFVFGATLTNLALGKLPLDEVKPCQFFDASLVITANMYFGDEDEEAAPLSETTFYLLDTSLASILKKSGFEPESGDGKEYSPEAADYLSATAAAFSSTDEESAIVALAITKEIKKHTLFQTKTDASGRARIKHLKTGNYFLFAVAKTEEKVFLWNLPVRVNSGSNSIEIDQYNSEISDSIGN